MEFPKEFIDNITGLLGPDEARDLLESLQEDAPVSVRLHPQKRDIGSQHLPLGQAVAWSSSGYYLTARPSFTFDPFFHAGCYYVQEASSMFLEQALRSILQDTDTVLDLCAAPGGKATLIASMLSSTNCLIANECVPSRAHVLQENILKWTSPILSEKEGASEVAGPMIVVTNNHPQSFEPLSSVFDIVLADVPCSGEGMFRKDRASVSQWSPAAVHHCAARQRDIIASVWQSLKPGGYLIYSTCTYNIQENEENIHWICRSLGAEAVPIPLQMPVNLLPTPSPYAEHTYRFLPNRILGEGFTLSLLRKFPSSSASNRSASLRAPSLNFLKRLRPLAPPPHTMYDSHSHPHIPLSYDQAIAFLRGETLFLPTAKTGLLVVTYNHLPLGYVKNVGTRANNLYPKAWRIRTAAPTMKM